MFSLLAFFFQRLCFWCSCAYNMGCRSSKPVHPHTATKPAAAKPAAAEQDTSAHQIVNSKTKHIEQEQKQDAGREKQGNDFSCSCCCQTSAPEGASTVVSSRKGVNAQFLRHFFFHANTKMKTWQLKKQFTIVATAADKCPLVEILKPEYVGQANVFVSHAYSYDLRDFIECILRYEEEHPDSIYWFDPFSLNQHPTPSGKVPTEELISAFGDRIEEFEATLIVASPWDNPAFLARAWCLFEFMCSHNAKKPITIMLPRKQEETFVKDLDDNWQVLQQALARIDSRTAQAKEQDDLQAINQEIQVTVTHHELNKMALTSMREWLVKTGLEQERRLRADKDRKRFLDF